jgi:hypothetical protein
MLAERTKIAAGEAFPRWIDACSDARALRRWFASIRRTGFPYIDFARIRHVGEVDSHQPTPLALGPCRRASARHKEKEAYAGVQMGGYGSGRKGGWATVEACSSLILNVDELSRSIREGLRQLDFKTIPEGRRISVPWRSIRWALSGEAEPWAVVEFRMDMGSNEGITWLRYDVEHFSMRTGSEHYPVSMLTTPCQFGGSRWWWLCPATGRRVGKLYLPNGGTRFLSRGPGAYRLAYASQRHGRVDRMHALWELTATDPPGTACRRSRKVCTGEPTTRYATGWKLRNTA